MKWDANRDPSQRFEAVVKFLHPRAFNYSADLSVSYPGRLVKGALLFAVLGKRIGVIKSPLGYFESILCVGFCL